MKNFPTLTGQLNSLMAEYNFRSIIKTVGATKSIEFLGDRKGWKFRDYTMDIAKKLQASGWTEDLYFSSPDEIHVQLSIWHDAGFTSTIDITHSILDFKDQSRFLFQIIVKES